MHAIKLEECGKNNVPYIAFIDEKNGVIYVLKPRCWCWNCKACAEARSNYWAKRVYTVINERMKEGERWYFVTITSHENCKNFAQTLYVLRKAFPKLYARMRRKMKSLAYVCVPEPHKDGRLHLHILTNFPMRTEWYKDTARECGFGYQADARELEEAEQCAYYVVKYLSKSLESTQLINKRFQRVRTTSNFPELENDQDFESAKGEVIGQYQSAKKQVNEWKRQGWKVIYSNTGDEL